MTRPDQFKDKMEDIKKWFTAIRQSNREHRQELEGAVVKLEEYVAT